MSTKRVLLIDNYDSFTYNLAQALSKLGAEVQVFRNDQISAKQALALAPSHVVISPGPCTPKEAGVSNDLIKSFAGVSPLLGVCLGHQCIGSAFGAKVERAPYPVHGKTSIVYHDGKTIFRGIKSPFEAMRYHSLIVNPKTLPDFIEISALGREGLLMGLRHNDYEIEGVQFHPESFRTEFGEQILRNFLRL